MGAEAFLTWCLAMTEWSWWKVMAVRGVVGWRTGILAAFTLVAAAVLAYWTRRHRRRSFPAICEQIPPPRTVSLQKNSKGQRDPCQSFKYLVELMEKHGPTVRVQEQDTVYVIVTQPEDVDSIRNGHVARPKSGLHRRIASSTFHNSVLRQYVNHFNRHSWTLGDQLEKTDGDIYPAVRMCSLKVLSEVLTGTVPNDDQSTSILQDLQNLQHRRFLPLQNLLQFSGANESLKSLYDFLDGVIAEKEEQRDLIKGKRSLQSPQVEYVQWVRGQEKCLLELLLEDNGQSPREELCELLASGTEVVALAVCYTLALLAEHPQVQERAAVEQDRVCISDKHATAEDLAIMIYLDQVIKESLRLFPPLPLQFWMVEQDTEISNYTLPSGSVAVVFSYATHRNWRIHPDPATFKPERFFCQDDPSQDTRYLAFGAGRGSCLAAKFSLWEMKTVISTLLRRYRISWAEGGGLQEIQNTLEVGPLLRPTSGFKLRFSPRPPKVIPSIFRNGTAGGSCPASMTVDIQSSDQLHVVDWK